MTKSYFLNIKRSLLLLCALPLLSLADTPSSAVTYLGNEALLFSNGDQKVLFDPFFHNDYGSYQLVPDEIRDAIFSNEAPYNDINLIVISHAHGDHFEAQDLVDYLGKHKQVTLLAPDQAIDKVTELDSSLTNQLTSLELDYGDAPIVTNLEGIEVHSVRIPHAGWPSRKEISNLVHRVTLNGDNTIIHMGDADPNDEHFAPYVDHWKKQDSDVAFPPYWFFISEQGPAILRDRINAKESIGVHVPLEVPEPLLLSGARYFYQTGQQVELK